MASFTKTPRRQQQQSEIFHYCQTLPESAPPESRILYYEDRQLTTNFPNLPIGQPYPFEFTVAYYLQSALIPWQTALRRDSRIGGACAELWRAPSSSPRNPTTEGRCL